MGDFLQGYAVIPDAKLILVSFQQYGLFLTFAPSSGRWTRVLTHTDKKRSERYLPIVGRGAYVEQHKAVYFLRNNIIYAYKLTYQKDDQGRMQQLKLDLPVLIDYVCPFTPGKGYGILTRLAGLRMCSVWISLAQRTPCPCENLHAIVTTFDLLDIQDPAEGGIKLLHSTYRRVDMVPNPPAQQQFCFLQEYEDQGSPVLQQGGEEEEGLTSSQHVNKPSKMLSCCRNMMEMCSITFPDFQCGMDGGHIAHRCSREPAEGPFSTIPIPPLGLTRSLPVDPASRQHQVCSTSPVVHVKGATTAIKKDLIIICQGGSQVVIYQTGAMDDDVKPIELCCAAVGDRDWHFFKNGSKIQAVSSMKDGMLVFSLNKERPTCKRPLQHPNAGPFVMVARVGQETIALTETLQIYHQTQFNYGPTTSWLLYKADESKVVFRRVDISGYVAMGDDSLIVCDAVTCSCLHFDLGAKQWSVVMPLAAFKEYPLDPTEALLNGRCVFVDGFIYTCRKGGLAAYELLREDHSLYLSQPIFLPLSRVHCVGEGICLDYAGKDVDSGATLLYVVQDEYSPQKYGVRSTTFSITTVKVRTQRTASNRMKPVGIDHMDSVTRSIHEAMDMRCCFAV
ncbi:uncharacterized protein LOC124682037 [Lolium rigidum]|uniref:uncharacterized protein LOC124682037 n=1 Tax=Lolium rigidum TaxID=89674 RepID=UPI001F5C3541|nr:uncharacterized protein LOC124682037 [Lolium rigidum]